MCGRHFQQSHHIKCIIDGFENNRSLDDEQDGWFAWRGWDVDGDGDGDGEEEEGN